MTNLKTDYSIVFAEVDEIFKYMSDELLKKIPAKLKEGIEEYKNQEYIFEYDRTKSLQEQNILEETKDFVSAIYLSYLCTKDEKERIEKICKENELKKVSKNEISFDFVKNTDKVDESNITVDNSQNTNLPSVNYNEKWYEKIINKIKSFFKPKM